MEIQNLIGLVLPPLIDFINARVPNPNWRYVISIVVCVAAAVAANFGDLYPFNAQELLTDVAMVFIAAQTTYQLYWKRSDAREDMKTAYLKGIDQSNK